MLATMAQTLESLRSQFPGAPVALGPGGLVFVKLQTAHGSAVIYLQGAHVTSYIPAGGREVLFVSPASAYQAGKAIRGGVPICFPWFGPRVPDPLGNSPQHGFARTSVWGLESVTAGEAIFSLSSSDATLAIWPHAFEAKYIVTLDETLTLALAVRNTGDSAFTFEEALHTYFAVSDVRRVEVSGLSSTDYLDRTRGLARFTQDELPITFGGEVDRTYVGTAAAVMIAENGRQIALNRKGNSHTSVVWNPGEFKGRAMKDLGDEWSRFVCVETANATPNALTLEPGQTHTMSAQIVPAIIGRRA